MFEESEMSVALMTGKGQQWLRLGERECTILDAMLEWAKATAKNSPDPHEGLAFRAGSIQSDGFLRAGFPNGQFY